MARSSAGNYGQDWIFTDLRSKNSACANRCGSKRPATNNQLIDDDTGQGRVDTAIALSFYDPVHAIAVVVISCTGGVWQWPYYLAAANPDRPRRACYTLTKYCYYFRYEHDKMRTSKH